HPHGVVERAEQLDVDADGGADGDGVQGQAVRVADVEVDGAVPGAVGQLGLALRAAAEADGARVAAEVAAQQRPQQGPGGGELAAHHRAARALDAGPLVVGEQLGHAGQLVRRPLQHGAPDVDLVVGEVDL